MTYFTLPDIVLPVDPFPGCHPRDAVIDAIELSRRIGCLVRIELNGFSVTVNPGSDADEVGARYQTWLENGGTTP